MTSDTFAIRLLRAKSLRGINQLQLACRLEMNPSAVHKWEQGRATPSMETLIRLAKVLDVSTDYLCGMPSPEPAMTGAEKLLREESDD